jgi:hypothetical protein
MGLLRTGMYCIGSCALFGCCICVVHAAFSFPTRCLIRDCEQDREVSDLRFGRWADRREYCCGCNVSETKTNIFRMQGTSFSFASLSRQVAYAMHSHPAKEGEALTGYIFKKAWGLRYRKTILHIL